MSQQISIEVVESRQGKIGVITLTHSKALNALTLPMIDVMSRTLFEWELNDEIVLIFLHSETPKAFCAGGDVKSLGMALLEKQPIEFAKDYFRGEYKLDHMIQRYSKPILCWAEGITMGGGIGIMNGASHRVVCENTMMAMPEAAIGFFPDVGASHFMGKLPFSLALFLGWTGARLGPQDALNIGWTDFIISSSKKKEIWQNLLEVKWSDEIGVNKEKLHDVLETYSSSVKPENLNAQFRESLHKHFIPEDSEKAFSYMSQWRPQNDWEKQCLDNFNYGAPSSLAVMFEQFKKAPSHSNLKDLFTFEWSLALRFCERHDFKEGVRALLIDKDRKPQWNPSSWKEIDENFIDSFFEPYPGQEDFRRSLDHPFDSQYQLA